MSNEQKPAQASADATRLAGAAYRTQIKTDATRVAGAGYRSILATQTGAPTSAGPTERYKIGDRIGGRYEVLAIHRGSMGVVYGTFDHKEQLPRALKTLQERFTSNAKMRDLFAEEAATWVQLGKHPFIVRAYLVEKFDGQPYVITEYIRGDKGMGGDLQTWLGHPRLTLKLAVEIALQIAQGMQHAVRTIPTLVHRDLKPANILVDSRARAMVTDFGLVCASEAEAGTPAYMSPEQWRGEPLDARTDIYSFGCILYEMFTGYRMFAAETIDQWRSEHLTRLPVAPRILHPDLPAEIEAAVIKCLAKAPEERPQNWDDVVTGLAALFHRLTGQPAVLDFSAYELTAMELLSAAFSLQLLGKYDEVISACNRVLAIDPNNAYGWGIKGFALRILKRYDEAIACYDRMHDIKPSDTAFWAFKAIALRLSERYGEAISFYDSALKIDPDSASLWSDKGSALIKLGHFGEAIECFEHALAIDRNDAYVWKGKGDAFDDLMRSEEAIGCYDHALDLDPKFANAWNGKGHALFKLKRYEEAMACSDRALEIDPNNSNDWNLKGFALYYLKRYEEAIRCSERILEIDPNSERARIIRNAAQKMLNQPNDN
jgi:tetratricopeptide (TPR) repeat protein